jgi:hypothetical protein
MGGEITMFTTRRKKPTRCRAALIGAAIAGLAVSSASAAVRISDDFGGQIGRYIVHYTAMRESGERVVIDGLCLSACTLVLGVIPRNRICVTSRARLGFHAAWRPGQRSRIVSADDGTQLLMDTYPQEIRDWIAQRGGLSPQLKYLSGRELAAMYQICS